MTNPNISSTKFIYCLLATSMAFTLVIIDKLAANDFLTFLNVMGGTYILGNVAAKYINSKSAD